MKKEVLVTNNLDKFSIAREKLAQTNIKYKYKVTSSDEASSSIFSAFFARSRRARGSYNENVNLSKMYYLYVDNKDYEMAIHCIK